MRSTEITMFDLITSRKAVPLTLADAFDMIRAPQDHHLSGRIEILRICSPSVYRTEKTRLPVLYFTGLFSDQTNKGLIKPSGLLIADFDKYESTEALQADRQRIEADPHVLACFVSPSGKGLKVVVRIPTTDKNAEYNSYFIAISRHFNNPKFDNNNKGMARACFYSHDPQIFVNWDAKVFETETDVTKPTPQIRATATALTTQQTFDLLVGSRECKGLDWSNGWNAALYVLACRCNDYNILLSEAKALCWNFANVDNTGYEEAMQTIESAYNNKSEGKDYAVARPKTPGKSKRAAVPASDGVLISSKDSIVLAEIESFGIAKNLLSDQFELSDGSLMTDEVINHIAMKARGRDTDITSSRVHEIINSPYTPKYHPFIQYLQFIESRPLVNGVIGSLLETLVLDGHHIDYKQRIIKKWLGGIVGTLSGSYSVMTLVFIGGQGSGKTSFFRGLLPLQLRSYFIEGSLTDDKDVFNRMCSSLIMYDDEFTGKNKTEASIYKKLSSADKFTYRKPYGRIDMTRNRTAVLCGSANESDVINDFTGNRRIIPVRIKQINHNLFAKICLDDLYRELLELHKSNPTWWHLTTDDIAFMNDDTIQNTAIDEFEERVTRFTTKDEHGHTAATEVERHIAARDVSYRPNINKLARALGRIYGGSRQKKIEGVNFKGYPLRLIS